MEKKIPLVKDSREPRDKYNFFHYDDVLHIGGHPIIDNLLVGDSSVIPYQSIFTIERKVLSDLIGSFSTAKLEKQEQGIPNHRQNFKEMWQRSKGYLQKWLMIEGSFSDVINQNFRSDFNRDALIASLISWSMRYKFNYFWVKDENEGQRAIYWYAKEFLKLKQKGEI